MRQLPEGEMVVTEKDFHTRRLVEEIVNVHGAWDGDGTARLRVPEIDSPRAEASLTPDGPEVVISTGLIGRLVEQILSHAVETDVEWRMRVASQALYLLYLHEVNHVRCGHLDFPRQDASSRGLRLVGHPMALIAAQAAFEYEADRLAVEQLVQELAGLDDADAGTLLVAVMEAALATSIMTGVVDRHVHARDELARMWSALGRFDETQIHPPLLVRRFLMLDAVVRLVDGDGPRSAVERAWESGAAIAQWWTSEPATRRFLGLALAELGHEFRDIHALAAELDLRIRLIREAGLITSEPNVLEGP